MGEVKVNLDMIDNTGEVITELIHTLNDLNVPFLIYTDSEIDLDCDALNVIGEVHIFNNDDGSVYIDSYISKAGE